MKRGSVRMGAHEAPFPSVAGGRCQAPRAAGTPNSGPSLGLSARASISLPAGSPSAGAAEGTAVSLPGSPTRLPADGDPDPPHALTQSGGEVPGSPGWGRGPLPCSA